MNLITYGIEAGEYALVVKYRANENMVRIEMGDKSIRVPLESVSNFTNALNNINRVIDEKKFLERMS